MKNLKSIVGILCMSFVMTAVMPTDIMAQSKSRKEKTEKKATPKAVNKSQAATPVKHYNTQPRRGDVITKLPQKTTIVNYRNSNYHYRDGIFYRPINGSYTIAAPPFGIHVSVLPPNPYRVVLTGRSYYYYYGTYYLPSTSGDGYDVVEPPLGARVDALPEGYEVFELEGNVYYRLDETYYKAVLEPNGYVVYEVVRV